jgi:hypothetical protein
MAGSGRSPNSNVGDSGAGSPLLEQYDTRRGTRLDIKMLESKHRNAQEDGPWTYRTI